ncbi:rab-like protein 3 isoform X1 [Mercenaria mercenaria]|uniref:rab-like protein 3 isoform X1 n=2 Tax=Mercenaria mercenaria TaxID=6596 RepID=UPI00234EA42E|nr:rab-like protein 3 isoform X1 [Mercenaria mercenaria]
MCQNEPTTNPSWTIGCSVDVKLHEYKAGTASEKTYFVELWDIGGCTGHQNSRTIFYNPVNGIILVHDLTNRKSQHNLRSWLAEVLRKDNKSSGNGYDYDPEEFAGNQIPLLVIGTKADQAENMRDKGKSRTSSVAEEFGADQFDLDCQNVKYLAPGSTNAVKLSRFFDKVIERRYYSRELQALTAGQGHYSPPPDRRRFKNAHID